MLTPLLACVAAELRTISDCAERAATMASIVRYVKLKYYQYQLTTALYMLEPWEQAIFSTSSSPSFARTLCTADHHAFRHLGANLVDITLLGILAMAAYTTYVYGPTNFYWFVASLLDYFPVLDTIVPGVRLSELLPAEGRALRATAASAKQ